MQNKNYLLPLLGGLGVVVGIVGLFLTAWILTDDTVVTGYGFFSGYEGATGALTDVGITFSSIWATMSMIALIVGIVAVGINIVMCMLDGEGNGGRLGRVMAWVAGVALVLFIVFGLVFTIANSGAVTDLTVGFSFGIGYWLGLIGLAFGTFFAFINSCMKKGI
ncbi:MAG: hypothetical protein PHR96_00665 [Clostridia bacterium]|nr:hypothetical protein [Clostridia bacterium]